MFSGKDALETWIIVARSSSDDVIDWQSLAEDDDNYRL